MEGWCGCHWISANLSVRGSAGWVPRGMGDRKTETEFQN